MRFPPIPIGPPHALRNVRIAPRWCRSPVGLALELVLANARRRPSTNGRRSAWGGTRRNGHGTLPRRLSAPSRDRLSKRASTSRHDESARELTFRRIL